jgi:hypothetical protein
MAYSIGANFLSFGYGDSATPLTGGASFGRWCGFSICFHVIFSRHVFIKKNGPANLFSMVPADG